MAMVCGSPRMVSDAVSRLQGGGLPSEAIRTEQFDYDRPSSLTSTIGVATQ